MSAKSILRPASCRALMSPSRLPCWCAVRRVGRSGRSLCVPAESGARVLGCSVARADPLRSDDETVPSPSNGLSLWIGQDHEKYQRLNMQDLLFVGFVHEQQDAARLSFRDVGSSAISFADTLCYVKSLGGRIAMNV